ncbi:MAG: RtcB family protein [Candidatus Nanoarchaeia archaeon]
MVELKKISDIEWEIPKGSIPGMRVPALIIASPKLLEKMKQDRTLIQAAGVACLPGIYKYSITLPDGHEGYGFPIGGVAAIDYEEGCISPGGIGYDINCGVRLVRSNLREEDVRPRLRELLEIIFRNIPSGVGKGGKIRVSSTELDQVLQLGAKWAVEHGFGWKEDLEHLEENGGMSQADPSKVSSTAKSRGLPQLGSLGAGNHFLEVQKVDKIYNREVAKVFGIEEEGQVMIMIHTGSRGLGHQVCSDYLREMERKYHEVIAKLPDRELVYAPSKSEIAENYFAAMCAAANYAWCNRQMILHWTRESFKQVFEKEPDALGLQVVYDVAHNIAKIEDHEVNGEKVKVFVHRKGATRAFPPGSEDLPQKYRRTGQPVLIPGCMGTASYVLVGNPEARKTFYSTAHGAGREMSRNAAIKKFRGKEIAQELERKGILVRAASWEIVAEEAPGAYKDIDEVAIVSDRAGIGKLVARLVPLGVVKG